MELYIILGFFIIFYLYFNAIVECFQKRNNTSYKHIHPIKDSNRGYVHCILGPMFSGKTEELMRLARRARIANKSCLLVKYESDQRYSKKGISSHADRIDENCILAQSPKDIDQKIKDYEYIFIDEIQFFNGITDYIIKWALEGKKVIVCGLDSYANQTMWSEIIKLIPWCDKIEKLSAICKCCGEEASMTKDLHHSDNRARMNIGGLEKYEARCRYCIYN